MESFTENFRAMLYSLLLHALCVGLLLLGLWWTHDSKPVVLPGPVIEAVLVGPTAAPKPGARAAKPKPKVAPAKPTPPKPEPAKPEPPAPAKVEPAKVEPEPEKAPPPPPPVKEDLVEQQRVAALAQQKADDAKREQEAKQRREQILLEQEQEREKKLEQIRKERAAAERAVKREQEKLQQLADRNAAEQRKADQDHFNQQVEHEAAQAQTGAGGQDDDLKARYVAAIQSAVTIAWYRPDSAMPGLLCNVGIRQIPGGNVLSVTIGSPCNADAATRNSLEQAVMRAAPLPYEGYQKVFTPTINFNFRYDG